jgi:hypothetical protein
MTSTPRPLGPLLPARPCSSGGEGARLRGLWSVWTVGVRISLGALESPAKHGGFCCMDTRAVVPGQQRGNTLLTTWEHEWEHSGGMVAA